jgi:hypothetical protein
VNTEVGVVRVDPETTSIAATIEIVVTCAQDSGGIVAEAGRVWTTSPCGSTSARTRNAGPTVVAIDPTRNAVVNGVLPIPARAYYLAVGLSSVWTVTIGLSEPPGYLFRLDDETGKELGRLRLPEDGPVVADLGAVWVAGGRELLRIEPVP